jgi:16S rRNA (guanine966-N2)-methyltransferase
MLKNRVRIIGGVLRGRYLTFPDAAHLRPTPNRVRETVFNWLMPYLPGAHCLDLFAGSGALGMESLSRGAAHVVFIEKSRRVVRQLESNLKTLGCDRAEVYHDISERYLKRSDQRFDVIFVDPPFGENLVPEICQSIQTHQRLKEGGVVYIERENERGLMDPLVGLPAGFEVLKHKRVGRVQFGLYGLSPVI